MKGYLKWLWSLVKDKLWYILGILCFIAAYISLFVFKPPAWVGFVIIVIGGIFVGTGGYYITAIRDKEDND
jgi:drug/metabolite transporter superfamily protein YnfA